ncbi:hypothetical protein F5Y07DRAFT_234500 [Xylaria sp. FL0933]|nr:hypothetical protein F5Y07DRAFT_234500 [Xylaria sp. FL0933]
MGRTARCIIFVPANASLVRAFSPPWCCAAPTACRYLGTYLTYPLLKVACLSHKAVHNSPRAESGGSSELGNKHHDTHIPPIHKSRLALIRVSDFPC